jgi:hypothetical protein
MSGKIQIKILFASIMLAVAILPQLSCKKSGLEMSDLLGAWTFQNTVTSSDYTPYITGTEAITLNADYTITKGNWNSNGPAFAFNAEMFRMVRGFLPYPLHITFYLIWEGEMDGDGLLTGKIYTGHLASQAPFIIMNFDKGVQIGSFSASRVSE